MEISNIIFIGVIAVVCIGKVVDAVKSQQTNTKDINKDTSRISLDKEMGIDSPKEEIPKPQHTQSKAERKVITAYKSTKEAPKNTQKSSDEEEFDLRKAVVYSEILTPKFKEEDF